MPVIKLIKIKAEHSNASKKISYEIKILANQLLRSF